MRVLCAATALLAVLGITGLIAGCNSGGGTTLAMFDPTDQPYTTEEDDTDGDGLVEFSPGETKSLYVISWASGFDCDNLPGGEVSSATLTVTVSGGTLRDGSVYTYTGADAVCGPYDSSITGWTVPTEEGEVSISFQLDVTYASGDTASDEVTYNMEVVA